MQEAERLLIARLQGGDPQAFRSFFDEYFDRLYRFALVRVGGRADRAEEAAQRAICRAVRALHQFRGESELFTWLAQICRNELADLGAEERRHAQHTQHFDTEKELQDRIGRVADGTAGPAQRLDAQQSGLLLRRILDELPGRYGSVLEWKYLQGWEVERIAAELGTSFEAAQSQLARARLALRAAIEARGIDWHEFLS